MWKRYLEREDSKIVGERWQWGCPPSSRDPKTSGGALADPPLPPPDLFVGQLKSCLKCQACGYRSTTFEVFCDLSLPIPKVGLGYSPKNPSEPPQSSSPTPQILPDPPKFPPDPAALQKSFAGGKVSLHDCFSLFTKEEELDSENAPVRGWTPPHTPGDPSPEPSLSPSPSLSRPLPLRCVTSAGSGRGAPRS